MFIQLCLLEALRTTSQSEQPRGVLSKYRVVSVHTSSGSLTPASVLLDSQALLGNELSEFKALVVGKSKKCSFSFACLKLYGQSRGFLSKYRVVSVHTSSDSLSPASVLLDSQALLGNELSEFKALVVGKSKKCSFSFACFKLERQHPRVPPRDALICLMRPPPRHYHVCSTQCGKNNFQKLEAEFFQLCYFMMYF